ncbi:MAG: type I-C CRISPR-associated protein Cas7/Csd2 [Hydrogenophilaceae bacterium]|nr:type I-C CRISPR-associated protein Cas7/Csd2 [Hydrogenophilaceae bacterium]
MSYTDPAKRHEFVLLFDVKSGNPNGDPDAGNLPRIDPQTMHGLVTDVALKRKVRDYLQLTRDMPIFIQSKTALNSLIEEAGRAHGIQEARTANDDVRVELCQRYYDIRMFGAVLSTGKLNAGQVRGPVQVTFARSIDPILPLDLSITRQARTTEERMETGSTEMGRKPIVPYGFYRAHGYFNPYLAEKTGVGEEDMKALWEALQNLFEFDRSAARGEMNVRGLYAFTHDDKKGNAPAHALFERIQVKHKAGVDVPRGFEDYEVTVEEVGMPSGVTLTRLC